MKRVALLVALLVLVAAPAEAARCRHGQIYRTHLHICVSSTSALARPYVHHARYTALHRRHRHHSVHAVFDIMHGDPIEDRVLDEPTPPELPDAFARSRMAPTGHIHWQLP